MRIGLLSDTHIPDAAPALPPQVTEAFRDVDLILHAGDIYIPSVLDELERIAPVVAACGDDDYGDTLRDRRVKGKHILKLEGQTLWLIHERPYLHGFTSYQGRDSRAQDKHDAPDIIVFGHEHRTVVSCSGDVLYVNPGSPTFLHYRRGLGTVGILNIESGEADLAILQLTAENQPTTVIPHTSIAAKRTRTTGRQVTAEELMKMPDRELELMVAERVMGWRLAVKGLEGSNVDSTGYLWKDQNGSWCSHRGFCSDLAASFQLDERMKKLGWHYEQRPTHPGNEGSWGYGVAYSSEDYWIGLHVESPSQIRKAKCAAAILALEVKEQSIGKQY